MGDLDVTGNQSGEGSADKTGTGSSLGDAWNEAAGETKPAEKPAVQSGDKANGTTGSTETSAEKSPAWTEQLPEDVRSNADMMKQLAKFQKVGDIAKAYSSLESKLGSSITLPGKDAGQDEVNAFYEKLGKPKTEDGYSVKDKDAGEFRKMAFNADLTDLQAKKLYEWSKTQYAAQVEKQNQSYTEAENLLKKEWGKDFDTKVETFKRGVKAWAGPDVAKALQQSGLNYNPAVVKMFVKLGEISAEAGSSGSGISGGKDGYKPMSEGGGFEFAGLKK
jgi:hypothetical protein